MSDFDENTQWACPACTLHNKLEDAKCSVCGGPQDASTKLAKKTEKEEEPKKEEKKQKEKEEEKVGRVNQVKVNRGDPILLLNEQATSCVRAAAFSNDGKYLAFSTKVPDVRVYCARSLKLIKTLDGQHTQNTPCLAWSPCSKFLLSGYGNGSKHQSRVYSVDLAWKDLPTTESENHMTSHNKPCTCGVFHPSLCSKKKLVFATGGYDDAVCCVQYDLINKSVDKILFTSKYAGEVCCLDYVPNNKKKTSKEKSEEVVSDVDGEEYTLIVATRSAGCFYLVNSVTGVEERKIPFKYTPWRIAAFHHSPYFAVASGANGPLFLYNASNTTGDPFLTLSGKQIDAASAGLGVCVSQNDAYCFVTTTGGHLIQIDLRLLLLLAPTSSSSSSASSSSSSSPNVEEFNPKAVTVFRNEGHSNWRWACACDAKGNRVASGFDGGLHLVMKMTDKFEDRRGVMLVREKGNENIKIVKVMREIYVVWFLVSKFL